MLNGSSSGFILVTAVILVAVALGVALGRYAWPRRPNRHSSRSAPAGPDRQGAIQAPFDGAPAISAGSAGAQVADARARTAEAEAQLARVRTWVNELEAQRSVAQSMQKETSRRLRQAESDLDQARRQVRDLEISKEAELGRLESGAISALESAIAAHREQVARLEEKLRAAQDTIEEHIAELTVERNRSGQLQSALAERDQHIATITSDRA